MKAPPLSYVCQSERQLGALYLAAGTMLPFFGGTASLPELRENSFIMHMVGIPGISTDESMRSGREVSAALLRDRDVKSIARPGAGSAQPQIGLNGVTRLRAGAI